MGRDVIGIDESGKGDYFGPLVAAGVYVPVEEAGVLEQRLQQLGGGRRAPESAK